MSGNGDIPNPYTWSVGGPALTVQPTAAPHGGGDSLDPWAWAVGGPVIPAQSTVTPPGHGDAPNPWAWAAGGPALAVQPTTTPHGNGDVMDPYAWMDVLVYLTSRVYPIDVLEWLTSHGQVFEQPQYLYREHVSPTGTLIGGTLTTNLYSYTNWPAEHVSVTGSFSGGTLA